MAHFDSTFTNAGKFFLTQAMHSGEKVFPDFVLAGSGIHSGNPSELTGLVSPLAVDIKLNERVFVDEGDTAVLKIGTQVTNLGLTEETPVRELMLYANSDGGADMVNAVPFAYAWLDGPGPDYIIPPAKVPGFADSTHLHEFALFVTNQQAASIEVVFSFHGFVTHRYFREQIAAITPRFVGDALVFGK